MPSPAAKIEQLANGNVKVVDAIPRAELPKLLRNTALAIREGLLETPARVYAKVTDGLTAAFEADEINNTNTKRMVTVLHGFAEGIEQGKLQPIEIGLLLSCGCSMIVATKVPS